MSHIKLSQRCHHKQHCPCTKEIAAVVPSSANASKDAILPTVEYLTEIPAVISASSNYNFAANLSGVLTIEGSYLNVDLGPYSLTNENVAIHIKNSTNVSIFRGTIIGNIIVENSTNINFLYNNVKGNLTITDSQLCRIRDATLESNGITVQMNNCNTCKIANATISGNIICQNCSTIDLGQIILELNNANTGLYMNNVTLGHVIDFIINGNNTASKGLVFENCDNLIVKLIDSKNIVTTHVEFTNVTNSYCGESLFNGNNDYASNGLIVSQAKNMLLYFSQFYNLKGEVIKITDCKALVCDRNVITDGGTGIVLKSTGITVQNNIITSCKYGIVNHKNHCNAFFSNHCMFSTEANYRHVPHITLSGEHMEVCDLNNVGALMNVGVNC